MILRIIGHQPARRGRAPELRWQGPCSAARGQEWWQCECSSGRLVTCGSGSRTSPPRRASSVIGACSAPKNARSHSSAQCHAPHLCNLPGQPGSIEARAVLECTVGYSRCHNDARERRASSLPSCLRAQIRAPPCLLTWHCLTATSSRDAKKPSSLFSRDCAEGRVSEKLLLTDIFRIYWWLFRVLIWDSYFFTWWWPTHSRPKYIS